MITLNTLVKLIDKYEEILAQAEFFGYVNLRLFCSYSEEDKHKLNFIANFDPAKRQKATHDRDISEILRDLLEGEVCLWGEGSVGLDQSNYEEAVNAPLSDMNKTIDYFIDTLIPYSSDNEPIEQQRMDAKQYWQRKTAVQPSAEKGYPKDGASPTYSVGHFKPQIPALIEQLSGELSQLAKPDKGKVLLVLIDRSDITLEELMQLIRSNSADVQAPPTSMVV